MDFAVSRTHLTPEDFTDGDTCTREELLKARGVRHFEGYIRRLLEEGGDGAALAQPAQEQTQPAQLAQSAQELTQALIRENPDAVILCAEVGLGVVPPDPAGRAWREAVGRSAAALAAASDEVWRVMCGIGLCLKDETPAAEAAACIEVYMVRHGATAGNLKQRYIGATDEPLCMEGREQIRRTRDSGLPEFDQCIVSPLKRCRESAQILLGESWTDDSQCDHRSRDGRQDDAVRNTAVPVRISPGLSECHFGTFEGKNYLEMADDPRYQAWVDADGKTAFPDGEDPEAFRDRICSAFSAEMKQLFASQAHRALFVFHGGCIMAIMERCAPERRAFYEWHVKNGEGFIVTVRQDEFERRGRFSAVRALSRPAGQTEKGNDI